MVLHPIPRDGDCLFTSIIYALYKATKPAKFCEHLQKLCLVDLSRSLLDRVTNLRSAMVQEWLENSEEYEPFMFLSDAKFEDIALTYKTPGSFSGACGNLMVMALANVLKINIVLFTSMEQMPVIPVIPRDALLTPHPIYIAFNHGGCGHYDAVDPISPLTDEENGSAMGVSVSNVKDSSHFPEKKGCKCGKDGAKEKKGRTFCHQVPGGRRSQCPCYRNHVECTDQCKCNNCGNPLGLRPAQCPPEAMSYSVPQRRQREKHSFQESHKDSLSYMLEHGEKPHSPKWSLLEKFLLQNMLDILITRGYTLDELDIPFLDDQLVDIIVKFTIDLPLSKKSSRSVTKQMDFISKGSDLFRQIYLSQVSRNVKY